MKKAFYKNFLVVLSLLMILASAPLSEKSSDFFGGNIVFSAQAASGKIQLKSKKLTLNIGKTYNQKLLNKKGKNISASKIKWKTANKKVATVSKKGKVTAKKAGKVKITATYQGKKYTFTVVVKADKNGSSSAANNAGDPDMDDSKGEIVYVTPTGTKYHIDPQCGGKNSKSADINFAKSIGLTPCKKCAL